MPERPSLNTSKVGDHDELHGNPIDARESNAGLEGLPEFGSQQTGESRGEADSGGLPPGEIVQTARLASLRRTRRRTVAAAAWAGLGLGLLYAADFIATTGTVPRGVTAAGIPVGGMEARDAERRLRTALAPRIAQPVSITTGDTTNEVEVRSVALAVDWRRTVDHAVSQPLNPLTRLASFFADREVGIISTANDAALRAALNELAPTVDKKPVEGSVRFVEGSPIPVSPVAGQRLDVDGAVEALKRDWLTEPTVRLPVVELQPITTASDVAAAVHQIAGPAVSGPITVIGSDGTRAIVSRDVIATALTFRAEGGRLTPKLDVAAVAAALRPQLGPSETPARDAALDFAADQPVTVPSADGKIVDYETTLSGFVDVLAITRERTIFATYADKPAEFTTGELKSLGAPTVIGEFQTGGFATDSGKNIRRAAENLDGVVVGPGETFSLNAETNPRNAATGYVEAGVIENGRPARGVGGGVSQLATTLFNAAYFAGMVDVEHREHSFYISRYPAGREATVSGDDIDLKFRNDGPVAVLIRTGWTPSTVAVSLLGVKRFDVTSTQGPRASPTSPETLTVPAGEPCRPSEGSDGFAISDTRTLREVATGVSRTETHTVRYDPAPRVLCLG